MSGPRRDDGPPAEAPILVLTRGDDANRFHAYVEEILLAEGYPWVRRIDLQETPLSAAALAQADVTILSHIRLAAEEEALLLGHVRDGGRLLALRPSPRLAQACGLRSFNPVRHRGQTHLLGLEDRWLRANAASPLGRNLPADELQFHSRADLYTWAGDPGAVVAHLAPFPGAPSAHPAVVATDHGRGRVALYTFDLATSTVLFHQGRREQSSTGAYPDYNGDATYKANDMFVGFLDERLKHVPQADVHQDLFVRLLVWLTETGRPLPRLWYFPHGARAVAFFNGDGDSMRAPDLANTIAQVERFGAPFTTYVMTENYPELDPAWEASLRARGHGFGQHVWAGPLPTPAEMRQQLRAELAGFRERYGHAPLSYRGHWVVWVGWTEMARYLAEEGIRLDTDFLGGRFFKEGYLNGSGLPVRFMDEQGRMIDLYEQCTISADDTWLTDKSFLPAYSIEECIAVSRRQLEEAVQKYHTVYHPYFHPRNTDPGTLHTQPWLTAMLWYCRKLNVPCVGDEDWVRFNDARRAMRLEALRFDGAAGTLDFALRAGPAIAGATVVLPPSHGGRRLTRATVDGQSVPITVEEVEGRRQARFSADFAAGQVRCVRASWQA
ncbi:MAG TPA: hypothetical protein VHS99_17045 [Chloroflexota bacterium]|nr:hypothetical protein [Chloroflexota bacterium]